MYKKLIPARCEGMGESKFTSRPSRFTSNCKRSWLGPSDVAEKRKIFCSCREANHARLVCCLASNLCCCIDCAIYMFNGYNNATAFLESHFQSYTSQLRNVNIYFNSLYFVSCLYVITKHLLSSRC